MRSLANVILPSSSGEHSSRLSNKSAEGKREGEGKDQGEGKGGGQGESKGGGKGGGPANLVELIVQGLLEGSDNVNEVVLHNVWE